MYSHAPPQQGAGFPNMAWGHEMQNSNPALHASSSSFGSMGKDAASRHNDSDDGSWDGNNNDRNGPSDAQLNYLKEKERYAQGPTGRGGSVSLSSIIIWVPVSEKPRRESSQTDLSIFFVLSSISSGQALTAEEKLFLTRERNR